MSIGTLLGSAPAAGRDVPNFRGNQRGMRRLLCLHALEETITLPGDHSVHE